MQFFRIVSLSIYAFFLPACIDDRSSSASQGNPKGSYQKTCTEITVTGNVLSASCRKLDNRNNQTTLTGLTTCLNSISQYGDIANIDGDLICMPDLPKVVAGFTFPRSETAINNWIYNDQTSKIHQHAWGLWAGLTSQVGQVDGTAVRAFETWNTISNMQYQMQSQLLEERATGAMHPVNQLGLDLKLPNQFKNKQRVQGNLRRTLMEATAEDGDTNIFVSVAYNPPAAAHSINNKLFLKSTLDQFLHAGYTEIPNFPVNSITIKPVYKVVSQDVKNGIYTFPGWPGTPSPAKTFPEKDWNACVYIDINSKESNANSIDPGCSQPGKTNTFSLDNFIHQQISAENAQYLSTQLGISVKKGDYAILVGMHVTSRETKRWTWQSFWWSASPDSPQLPSSTTIAAQRPNVLDQAARHYAMTVAYQMVTPAQPINGGENVGSSVIGYNPHLEAGFDPGVFQIIRKINGTIDNQYGVQTNCMTCHNLALYNPSTDYAAAKGANRQKPYGTDYYMPIDDPIFNKVLKLDFAWSVLGGLLLDK